MGVDSASVYYFVVVLHECMRNRSSLGEGCGVVRPQSKGDDSGASVELSIGKGNRMADAGKKQVKGTKTIGHI